MDICNVCIRDISFNQLSSQLIVYIKSIPRGGYITEHDLRCVRLLPINTSYIIGAASAFVLSVITCLIRSDKSNVQSTLSSINRDFEKIVLAPSYSMGSYSIRPVCKIVYVPRLRIGFVHKYIIVAIEVRQLEFARRYLIEITHFAEHRHKFRQIVKL